MINTHAHYFFFMTMSHLNDLTIDRSFLSCNLPSKSHSALFTSLYLAYFLFLPPTQYNMLHVAFVNGEITS